jgi:GNAT superfamily N-acetyltransferase
MIEELRFSNVPPSAENYIHLRIASGMGEKNLSRAETALRGSLFTASLYDGEALVAFGRVAGDGGITFVVSDVMVHPDYRRRGLGDRIMSAIDEYFHAHTFEDSYVCLIANRPADLLYTKHRFRYLPPDRCGMLRDQSAAPTKAGE